MTASKAIEYLVYILKQHPHIESADFGSAIKLGTEAIKRLELCRSKGEIYSMKLLPGEDPE